MRLSMSQSEEINQMLEDLKKVHELEDRLPPGDRRAEVKQIADRIRAMVCQAEGAMIAGRDTANITARINNLIKVILNGD